MDLMNHAMYRVNTKASPPRLERAVVLSPGKNGWYDVHFSGKRQRMRLGSWHKSAEDAWFEAIQTCFSATYLGYLSRMSRSHVTVRAAFRFFREQGNP